LKGTKGRGRSRGKGGRGAQSLTPGSNSEEINRKIIIYWKAVRRKLFTTIKSNYSKNSIIQYISSGKIFIYWIAVRWKPSIDGFATSEK
jgi:hypothetical protein